jgi:tetratricopeptide (TPR) repeat protein
MKCLRKLFCLFFSLVFVFPVLAEEPMSPSQVSNIYIYGQQKDPAKAIELIQQWLDVNRDDPQNKGFIENDYFSALDPYRLPKDNPAAVQFLLKELKAAKNPKTIYAIYMNLAKVQASDEKFDEAIDYWKAARESMIIGTHPYFTTRQALPLLEIARIYHFYKKDDDRAIEFYELFRTSEYGKTSGQEVIQELGDIYKSRGEWQKTKELYQYYYDTIEKQSWANEDFKKQALDNLRKQLDGFSQDDQSKVDCLAQRLSSEDWFQGRKAFFELKSTLKQGKKEDWLLWMDQYLKKNPDPKIKMAFCKLRQYLSPPFVLGPDREELMAASKNFSEDEKKYKVFNDVLDMIREDKSISASLEKVFWGNEKSDALGQLCLNQEYRDLLSQKYTQIRNLILQAQDVSGLPKDLWRGRSVETLQQMKLIMKDPAGINDFLRKVVSFQNQYSGPAAVLLYSLGNREDIGFIIENIPLSAHQRNYMLWSLASSLYRYGVVDVPRILGVDKEPYLDWWNVKIPGTVIREKLLAWWQKEKGNFSYTRVQRPGTLLRGVQVLSGVTQIILAPEINGIFWLEEGGRDYAAAVYYFNFSDEQTTKILDGGFDGIGSYSSPVGWQYEGSVGPISGMDWNAAARTLEFTIGQVGTFGAVFEGTKLSKIIPVERKPIVEKTIFNETIQNYGAQTFEIREGDLFLVDEKSGDQRVLLDYGYVLSFFLDTRLQKAVIVDRDILGQSLWLVDLDELH